MGKSVLQNKVVSPFWFIPIFKNKFLYISVIDEASAFKFGMHLRSAKAHHNILPSIKSRRGPGLEELPKILGFLFHISATAEFSDFEFGM